MLALANKNVLNVSDEYNYKCICFHKALFKTERTLYMKSSFYMKPNISKHRTVEALINGCF